MSAYCSEPRANLSACISRYTCVQNIVALPLFDILFALQGEQITDVRKPISKLNIEDKGAGLNQGHNRFDSSAGTVIIVNSRG
jgi:hypothetical protein